MSAWRTTMLRRVRHEGGEAVVGDEAPARPAREARLAELIRQLVGRGQAAAALRHRAPDVQDVDRDAGAETDRRQEEASARAEKAADVSEKRDALGDREVIDVVVQRHEVELGAWRPLAAVAELDADAIRETPARDVLARERRRVALELEPDGGERPVPLRSALDVDAGAAADLEEARRPVGRNGVVDGVADDLLEHAG